MGNNDKLTERLIHLELVKSDNKNTKVKKYLPMVAIMATWYYSLILCAGLLVGYFASKIYSKYTLEKGSVDSIYVDCGKWKLHFHHWMMGFVVLALVWFLYPALLSPLVVGMILGVIAHDFYDYNDWKEILVPNENHPRPQSPA